jgi:hypothetical protein
MLDSLFPSELRQCLWLACPLPLQRDLTEKPLLRRSDVLEIRHGTLKELAARWKSPRPKGSAESWNEALDRLRTGPRVPVELAFETRLAVGLLLDGLKRVKRSPKPSEEQKNLDRIVKCIVRLDESFACLSPFTQMLLCEELIAHGQGDQRRIPYPPWRLRYGLEDVRKAAEVTKEKLYTRVGKKGGGVNWNMARLTSRNPYEGFIVTLIGIYAKAHGWPKVSSTTSSEGKCYNFIDTVFQFATGKPIKREKPFKALVRSEKRRIASGRVRGAELGRK